MTTTPATTLYELLESRASTLAGCLVETNDHEPDEQISGAELLRRSRAVAGGFARLGVGPGDRVAIWLPNRSAWLVAFFACAQLGAIAVSINTRFRAGEVGDLLRRSGAKLLVYWPGYKAIDFAGILAQCDATSLTQLEQVVLYTEGDTELPQSVADKPVVAFGALASGPGLHENAGRPDSPCVIFTTSGTTKAPKLVVHDQRHVLSHAFNVARQYALGPQDRFLLVPPFCGVYGFCSAMAALAAGTPLILAPTWNPEHYARLIDSNGVTHFTASNEAVAQLFEVRPTSRTFETIKFIVSANINPTYSDIAERAEKRGLTVIGLYGSSELQALFSHGDPKTECEWRARAGGTPASTHAKVRTRNPETRALCTPGEAGELEFLAPESRFVEYFNDPEATRNALTDDGYFRSGDLGVVERDGSFTYLGRIGDTLRLGGFLVSPAEIEDWIQTHPSVAACQIVGAQLKDASKPVAFVIARPGAQVDEAAVIRHVAERLAKYKVPVKVYVMTQFPTTPSANGAKVQKNKLREIAEARLAEDSE